MASGFWPLASGSLFPFGVIAGPSFREGGTQSPKESVRLPVANSQQQLNN